MKALTLWQPWASLIAIGAKRIETRSWGTTYRGPLAIHAALTFPPDARAFFAENAHGWPGLRRELPFGAVVATCRLVNVLQIGRRVADAIADGAEVELGTGVLVDEAEAFVGNFDVGRFAWILTDIVAKEDPKPVKGARGLWEWTP